MTAKQQQILDSALNLFATKGFEATSTRSIAQKAGVSEGLIFRHFENKEGLLRDLLKSEQKKLETLIHTIDNLTHPKVILKHVISLPFNISRENRDYWRVFYSLRWQKNIESGNFLERLSHKVTDAFRALDYSDPKSESWTFMMIWEGAMAYILLNNPKNSLFIYESLLSKFEL